MEFVRDNAACNCGPGSEIVPPSVLAIVLTFNAPEEELASCVRALQNQVLPPSGILLIDNHGDHDLDCDMLATLGSVPLELLRLDANVGPAGGYAIALDRFLEGPLDCAWLMDDDVQPFETCLHDLVRDLERSGSRAVVGPRIVDATSGADKENWGWVGVLIPRVAVEKVGVPRAEYFWGLEDQEYLRDRLPLAGYPLKRSKTALVQLHDRGSATWAPWKLYYVARNVTFRYVYERRHIALSTRLKSLVHEIVGCGRAALTRDRDRLRSLGLVGRGVIDGLARRLGKRVDPDVADRPWPSNAL